MSDALTSPLLDALEAPPPEPALNPTAMLAIAGSHRGVPKALEAQGIQKAYSWREEEITVIGAMSCTREQLERALQALGFTVVELVEQERTGGGERRTAPRKNI